MQASHTHTHQKKKKHKKHKKRKEEEFDLDAEGLNDSPNEDADSPPSSAKKKKGKEEASSDEERWLDAIESGKLEEVDDELKKIKDPKLMTARQRAMYDRNHDRDASISSADMLMSLPSGYREKEKIMTAEALQKAQLQSARRKQQMDEKREKDKKKTMERLLKKQDSKQRGGAQIKTKVAKPKEPMISYRNCPDGSSSISIPLGFVFPLKAKSPINLPKPKLCGIKGCNNLKIYNCSKTKVPLCSTECYKKNIESMAKIIY
ncbi:INO80B family protein [Megaselia abdita]